MFSRILSSAAIAAVSFTVISGAQAADLPYKAAPMPVAVPAFTWTGFYLGAHFGAGWGSAESTVAPGIFGPFGVPISTNSANGFLGGVQAGYNWQINQWVLGIEGDFSWADVSSNSPCAVFGPGFSCSGKAKWMADITGRVGVTVDRALVYIKGGVAWADTSYNFAGAGVAASTDDTRIGALFGFGVEYAVARNWSAKIEYNYIDYGSENQNFLFPGPFAVPVSIDQRLHVMKAGVNFRF